MNETGAIFPLITEGRAVMSSSDLAIPAAPVATAASTAAPRYLFGPRIDFLCLGGGSIFLLPLIALLPVETYKPGVAAGMMLLANFINHPHFAHSYQIFYRGFGGKAFGAGGDSMLRLRYILAGLVVPCLLALFFIACLWREDVRMLGYSANLMALLVGWHYVKQGYGMLMVDATLKRKFFSSHDKIILQANGYAVWAAAWLWGNDQVRERDLWGLKYFTFDMPGEFLTVAAAVAVVTAGMTALMLARRWKANGGTLPFNGLVAYLVTLYSWTLFVKVLPLWLFVVPALHSLQYMIVVYRFQSNYENARPGADAAPRSAVTRRIFGNTANMKLAVFAIVGLVLGFVGFFGAPIALQWLMQFDRAIFGPAVLLFVFWIFVNVHHYFIDSVMWRRENPEARRFLFS